MKAGTRSRAISAPMPIHTTTPSTVAAAKAAGAGQPCQNTSTAATAPASPTPLPADRSIWPGSNTSSMPSASVAVIASSTDSSDRLRADRNTGSCQAKKAQIASSASSMDTSRVIRRCTSGRLGR
jgi:hypothetical protein